MIKAINNNYIKVLIPLGVITIAVACVIFMLVKFLLFMTKAKSDKSISRNEINNQEETVNLLESSKNMENYNNSNVENVNTKSEQLGNTFNRISKDRKCKIEESLRNSNKDCVYTETTRTEDQRKTIRVLTVDPKSKKKVDISDKNDVQARLGNESVYESLQQKFNDNLGIFAVIVKRYCTLMPRQLMLKYDNKSPENYTEVFDLTGKVKDNLRVWSFCTVMMMSKYVGNCADLVLKKVNTQLPKSNEGIYKSIQQKIQGDENKNSCYSVTNVFSNVSMPRL